MSPDVMFVPSGGEWVNFSDDGSVVAVLFVGGTTESGALFMLVLLRVYIIVAIPIVGYAFVHALLNSPH